MILEKFVELYKEVGLNVCASMPSVDSINEDNRKLRQFEITPNPFGEADNKLLVGVKYHEDGNLYVHARVHPGQEGANDSELIKEKYNELVQRHYGVR